MKKVTKKLACELAKQYIGSGKIDKEEPGFYFFRSGKVLLSVHKVCTIEREQDRILKRFQTREGPYWDKEVISCRLWVGSRIKEEAFFTPDLEEIWHEWHE